jgi:hypothetical protein
MENKTLYDLISKIESNGDLKATRFETKVFDRIATVRTDGQKSIISNIEKSHNCSWHTALQIYSTSYGATQIMGFNLYAPFINYDRPFVNFLIDEKEQKTAFKNFTVSKGLQDCTLESLAASHSERIKFALTYNGGKEYTTKIIETLRIFNRKVII